MAGLRLFCPDSLAIWASNQTPVLQKALAVLPANPVALRLAPLTSCLCGVRLVQIREMVEPRRNRGAPALAQLQAQQLGNMKHGASGYTARRTAFRFQAYCQFSALQ